jgi:hypothetical protein
MPESPRTVRNTDPTAPANGAMPAGGGHSHEGKGGMEMGSMPGMADHAAAATQASQPAAAYICPMHSEITSDKPAACPKCGMKLVQKK